MLIDAYTISEMLDLMCFVICQTTNKLKMIKYSEYRNGFGPIFIIFLSCTVASRMNCDVGLSLFSFNGPSLFDSSDFFPNRNNDRKQIDLGYSFFFSSCSPCVPSQLLQNIQKAMVKKHQIRFDQETKPSFMKLAGKKCPKKLSS